MNFGEKVRKKVFHYFLLITVTVKRCCFMERYKFEKIVMMKKINAALNCKSNFVQPGGLCGQFFNKALSCRSNESIL